MENIYSRPKALKHKSSSFCPGCLHGVAHNLIAEVIEELDMIDQSVAVLSVGCSCLSTFYWDIDNVNSPHGRAPAVATGVKRNLPDKLVFSYQGDGDLASIGLAEIMHAANRGENFTSFFINNSTYGMTGGQMAPTTLIGQKATTSPLGRKPETEGYPMKMGEIIAQLQAPVYVARFSLDSPKNILKAKKGIRKAFEMQLQGKGFTFIELLTNCPTNWGMSALKSIEWMRENTLPAFPLGEIKSDLGGENDGE